MIEVRKAWLDEGNFVGFATLGSSAEDGIFVADQAIRMRTGHASDYIVYGATQVTYEVTGDGLSDSDAARRLDEFATDIAMLNDGNEDVLKKYVAPQARRDPVSRYEALGGGAIASFRFGDGYHGPGAGWQPNFRANFIKEYALVEALMSTQS